MLISWTTGGKPTASITLFLKRIGSLPLTNADPHGSAGGSEPARFPSSVQTARNDLRMCGSGTLEPRGALFRIRGRVSHTARKLVGAMSFELR
jgi:hypothetical protein